MFKTQHITKITFCNVPFYDFFPASVVPEALQKHQSVDIIYAMQQLCYENLNVASEHRNDFFNVKLYHNNRNELKSCIHLHVNKTPVNCLAQTLRIINSSKNFKSTQKTLIFYLLGSNAFHSGTKLFSVVFRFMQFCLFLRHVSFAPLPPQRWFGAC